MNRSSGLQLAEAFDQELYLTIVPGRGIFGIDGISDNTLCGRNKDPAAFKETHHISQRSCPFGHFVLHPP